MHDSLIGALWLGVYNYLFLRAAKAIAGRVVAIDTTSSEDSGSRHMPIIEYTNPQGQTSKFTASVSALNSKIGDKLWVAYREETQTGKLLSLGEIFLPFTIFCLFGIVLMIILVPLPKSSEFTYQVLKMLKILGK
ncbi:MAG: hypothetical protein QNJ63_04850 [Calothrix sp. MO_192.B10]|nr:hypothetical protein [Calothrix sp. MO_192.B10]